MTSKFWYLLPIFMGTLGGILAFIALRKEDYSQARWLLIFGTVLSGCYVAFYILFIKIALLA